MIDELRAIAIFAEMVKQGSFRGAAKVLSLSPSVVSYHISQLEKHVGTALVYRSTRRLSLTHEGEVLYEHAQQMLASARQGLALISTEMSEPSGRLTITIPSALTRAPINCILSKFSLMFPRIELNLSYTDVRQDLIACGIDIAIRAGEMADSTLKAKLVSKIDRKLVCTPDYLKQQNKPKHPQDLSEWHWIKLAMLPNHRTLINSRKAKQQVHFTSNLTVDNVEALTQFCLNGSGLATPPSFLVDDFINKGTLVEVLSNWRVESIPVYAVWHANASSNSNIRRLLNFIDQHEGNM